MKTSFFIVLVFAFLVSFCAAEPTNSCNGGFIEWGESVHDTRLSICVSNDVVFTNSEVAIRAKMENLSTNTDYMSDSSPEQDFTVLLKSELGKEYQLTQRPWIRSRNTTDILMPNEKREWTIHVRVDRYFPPPGLFPAKTGVPPEDYTLIVTRKFRQSKETLAETIQANLLKIRVH